MNGIPSSASTMIEHWQTLSSKTVAECRIFSVEMVEKRHPSRGLAGEFAFIRTSDWVNIIPLTDAGTVILVRQYRHGTGDISLELPGGIIDEGEDPREAAQRECVEETGYRGMGEAELIGVNDPNPALQGNRCYSFLWRGCSTADIQHLDEHEEIEIVEVPIGEVPALIREGRIRHSLILAAFLFYFLQAR